MPPFRDSPLYQDIFGESAFFQESHTYPALFVLICCFFSQLLAGLVQKVEFCQEKKVSANLGLYGSHRGITLYPYQNYMELDL